MVTTTVGAYVRASAACDVEVFKPSALLLIKMSLWCVMSCGPPQACSSVPPVTWLAIHLPFATAVQQMEEECMSPPQPA